MIVNGMSVSSSIMERAGFSPKAKLTGDWGSCKARFACPLPPPPKPSEGARQLKQFCRDAFSAVTGLHPSEPSLMLKDAAGMVGKVLGFLGVAAFILLAVVIFAAVLIFFVGPMLSGPLTGGSMLLVLWLVFGGRDRR